jgi:glucose-6-phosphate 1-dehydrogenase
VVEDATAGVQAAKAGRMAAPGVASDDITAEQLVKHAREAIADSGQDVDDAVFDRLARRLSYLPGDVTDAALHRPVPGVRRRPRRGQGAGDHQLFAWEDSVEETWRIVQPLLDRPPDVRPYPRGSWGPDDAETLVHGHPRW